MNTTQPPDRTLTMLLDNQHAPLQETLQHLLAQHTGQALDICTTRLTPASWVLLHEGLQRIGNLRLLLNPAALIKSSDNPLEDISSSFTPHQKDNKHASDTRKEQFALTEALITFLQQEHVEVRLAEHTHLHARCFLFYADQDSARIAPQTAIVGSSDLTRAGLLTNADLNVVHRAHLTHEDIALKRLRGLLEREERTLLLQQCTQEQRLLAARLPTLLLLEHLTTWFAHHWEHATNGKQRLIAHLQTHKPQHSGAPMKQHEQPGRAPEEAQPPYKKNASAPLSGIPREETWAEYDYTQHQRD